MDPCRSSFGLLRERRAGVTGPGANISGSMQVLVTVDLDLVMKKLVCAQFLENTLQAGFVWA